jgi:ABC-2 type transport system permease protein
MRALVDLYRVLMRTAVVVQFQYRVANYFYMIGMVVEPVVYIIVWSAVARARGGEVGGYAPGQLAAYYIVWTLVRNMNIVFTPYGWEWRIRRGRLSSMLLRPIHPVHYDLAYFAGWKVVAIVLWLPIAAILALAFRPALHPSALEIAVFAVAIWGAYLVRSMWQTVLGMITFWTTRVGAFFELYFAAELLLSGRLVPMALLPAWAQQAAWLFPFQWTFGFPIESLAGGLTPGQLLVGLSMQAFWTAAGAMVLTVVWKRAIRHYAAVGG